MCYCVKSVCDSTERKLFYLSSSNLGLDTWVICWIQSQSVRKSLVTSLVNSGEQIGTENVKRNRPVVF